MNLVLHGIRKANVKRANTLSDMGGLTEDDLSRRYKVILSNPPFAGVLPKESIRKDLPTNSKKSELPLSFGNDGGLGSGRPVRRGGARRAALRFNLGACGTPPQTGRGFRSAGRGVAARRGVQALRGRKDRGAGLPPPAAGAKKNKQDKHKDKIWFYDVRADGFDPDKISGGGRPETPERNDLPELLTQWRIYKDSKFSNPPGVEAGTLLPSASEEPRCWWTSIKNVADNDYNLAAGRYKPRIAEKAPDDDPKQLIREILEIEREIAGGLEKLLQDVESVE